MRFCGMQSLYCMVTIAESPGFLLRNNWVDAEVHIVQFLVYFFYMEKRDLIIEELGVEVAKEKLLINCCEACISALDFGRRTLPKMRLLGDGPVPSRELTPGISTALRTNAFATAVIHFESALSSMGEDSALRKQYERYLKFFQKTLGCSCEGKMLSDRAFMRIQKRFRKRVSSVISSPHTSN